MVFPVSAVDQHLYLNFRCFLDTKSRHYLIYTSIYNSNLWGNLWWSRMRSVIKNHLGHGTSTPLMNLRLEWFPQLLWCTMIFNHWSWPRSSQRNVLFIMCNTTLYVARNSIQYLLLRNLPWYHVILITRNTTLVVWNCNSYTFAVLFCCS